MKTSRIILWTMAAVLSVVLPLFATSCTTEDNPVKPTEGKALITVNTVALYDKLGLTEEMSESLKEGWVIVDTVLVYDEAGHLVTKLGAGTTTLNPLTIDASGLSNGTYTLVAFQIATFDGISVWKLDGEELLSSVNVTALRRQLNCEEALGYASATVTVDGGTLEATVSPRPLCSVLQVWMENFDESISFKEITVETERPLYVNGCYLDPSLSDVERRIKSEVFGYEIIACFAPGERFHKGITLSVGENTEYIFWGRRLDGSYAYLGSNWKHLTAGENYIYYMDWKRYDSQPSFLGTLDDFAAWKAERDAGILDFYPCLNWGCNVDEVRQYVQSKQWWKQKEPGLEYDESNNLWGEKWDIASSTTEGYRFTTEDGENLMYVYIVCYDSNLTMEAVKNSLILQGYDYAGKIVFPGFDPIDTFFSADGKSEVFLQDYGYAKLISYQPTDPDDFQYIVPAEDEDEVGIQ